MKEHGCFEKRISNVLACQVMSGIFQKGQDKSNRKTKITPTVHFIFEIYHVIALLGI